MFFWQSTFTKLALLCFLALSLPAAFQIPFILRYDLGVSELYRQKFEVTLKSLCLHYMMEMSFVDNDN